MPRKDWSQQLTTVTFKCTGCHRDFTAEPDLVEPDPEFEAHPFRYYANCTRCGAENQRQAGWERALMKAHQESTGPKSEEGKAASSSNLAGHPTPDAMRVIRFNAMKHGMQARVATFFPAKPGKYAFCAQCDVDWAWCMDQPACVKQTELFMLHHAAVEQRNPKHLGKIHADIIAAVTSALQLCLQTVLADGVVIKTPRVELARDGTPVALTYMDGNGQVQHIYDYHSNPAFKPITDLISRLGLSMQDLGLTFQQNDQEDPAGQGFLQVGDTKREDLVEFNKRAQDMMLGVKDKLAKAQARMRSDPVLIEHEANEGGT
jgi:hypothetical protein